MGFIFWEIEVERTEKHSLSVGKGKMHPIKER